MLLLGAVGQMTSLQPARDVMVERARQVAIDFAIPIRPRPCCWRRAWPGSTTSGSRSADPALPTDTEALLRLTIPANDDLGTQEIQLSRVAGNAFEYHGSELGIAADWEFTVILRATGHGPDLTVGPASRSARRRPMSMSLPPPGASRRSVA